MTEITATLVLLGLTFYSAPEGAGLACGGIYTETEEGWAAVPIEWLQRGYVSCGDTLYARFANGVEVAAPIRDSGCLLHYGVWDTGVPFGADFPAFMRKELGPTGTGEVAVRRKGGEWWDIPPLTAWGRKWCNGPLTQRVRRPHRRRR